VATSNEKKERKCRSEGKMRVLHLKRTFLITVTSEKEVHVGTGLTNGIYIYI
jgi:hypothetical protein